MSNGANVDEKLLGDLFSTGGSAGPSPFTDALEFVERHLVALSNDQAQALAFLQVLGGKDKAYKNIIDSVLEYRSLQGDVGPILQGIEAVALWSKFTGVSGVFSREKVSK